MWTDLAYNVSVVLIALSFAGIAGIFAASGVLLWRMIHDSLQRRRATAETLRRLESEFPVRKSYPRP